MYMSKLVKSDKNAKEKNNKKKIIALILLILLFTIIFSFMMFNLRPTKPILSETTDDWYNAKVVGVEEDSKSNYKIDYYLYCVTTTKNTNSCDWKKTLTKSIEVTNQGINYVYFKAVDEKGNIGDVSDPCIVLIDTVSPEIIDVTKSATTNTIDVEVNATDDGSGIDKYYYKLDDGDYDVSNDNKYQFTGLKPDTEYKVTIKVVDKAGNYKIIEFTIRTLTISENNTTNDNTTTNDS